MSKHFRLLPAVIVLGAALLVLKGTGLVRDARAAGETAGAQQVASSETAPPRDFASVGDDEGSSASEVDVLSSLAKRRAELDQRDKGQDMRENVLAATEKRVDGKIAALKQLQAQITALLGQRDAQQEAQVKALVKTYSAMKPKDAARIFDGLADDVLVPVAQEMKSDALAPVLAAMKPENAQKLTVKLASRLNLPEKAGTDTATAASTPAPTQTAAASTTAPSAAEMPPSTQPQPVPQTAPPPAAKPSTPPPQAAPKPKRPSGRSSAATATPPAAKPAPQAAPPSGQQAAMTQPATTPAPKPGQQSAAATVPPASSATTQPAPSAPTAPAPTAPTSTSKNG